MSTSRPSLCLASASGIRRRLLEAAGVRFDVEAPRVDESAFSSDDPRQLAKTLARAKAEEVSLRRPGRLVLGADQVFTLDGRFRPKPKSREELAAKLRAMNGRTHVFHCGMVLVKDGETVHEVVDRAAVTCHQLSDEEIETYVETGEGLGCAGGYRLEEGGVRLIAGIEGSHFTVLGLPMLQLVTALRELGLVPAIFVHRSSVS